ncbi:MAG: PspA/IM30 family protein [Chthonomonadales bacterium]
MWKRIVTYVRGLVFGTLDKWESPEVILDQAVREMKEGQSKNRERAVQAITAKNSLAALVDKEEKSSRSLEAKATTALQQGNRDLARVILREKGTHDASLESLRASLKQAEETSEQVKIAIRREDERIRAKTADALRLKANLKQSEIQIQINKALDGFNFEDAGANFSRAEEKIQNMQSEADARAEVAKTSIDARLSSLDDAQVDLEADKALAELELKLGMTSNTSSTPHTSGVAANVQESDIDKQLRELEQKLNQTTS